MVAYGIVCWGFSQHPRFGEQRSRRALMIRTILLLSHVTILMLGGLAASVQAMDGASSRISGSSGSVSVIQTATTGLSQLPNLLSGRASAVEPAQYSCRRSCKRCRRRCIVDWKYDCYGAHCRRGFSQCMKYCWSDICRECG